MRQQFPFYKSFDDVAEDLTDIQLATYIRTLLDVQFLRVKIDDVSFKDKMLNMVWKSQKHSISKSINGFLDGQKRNTIKNPYFGAYVVPAEGIRQGIQIPAEGIRQGMRTPEEEVQVQCKGEEEVQGKEQCKEQGEVQVQVQVNECVFVPSSIDSMLWTDFLSLRNKLKAPNTKRALTAIINKLMKFQEQGYSPNDIISTSYENGWKGVFEPRKEFNQQKSFKQQDIQRTDDAIDAFLEARDNGFDLRNLTDEQFNDVEVIEQCN